MYIKKNNKLIKIDGLIFKPFQGLKIYFEALQNYYLKFHIKKLIIFKPKNKNCLKKAIDSEDDKKYGHISCWNTNSVTDMSDIFPLRISKNFNKNINNWNINSVINMNEMFYYCNNLNLKNIFKLTNNYKIDDIYK